MSALKLWIENFVFASSICKPTLFSSLVGARFHQFKPVQKIASEPPCANLSRYALGSALASLSVEARNYFLNKPNLQKLFPKSTLSWETIWNYFLNKPNLQKLFLKSTQFAETIS